MRGCARTWSSTQPLEAVQALLNIDEDLLFEAFEFLEKEKRRERMLKCLLQLMKTYEADGLRQIFAKIMMDGDTIVFNIFSFSSR